MPSTISTLEIKMFDEKQIDNVSYYALPGGGELHDLIDTLPFDLASAVKYIYRAGRKPGEDADKDIAKARHYLDRFRRRLDTCLYGCPYAAIEEKNK